jgi:hypothetical protein
VTSSRGGTIPILTSVLIREAGSGQLYLGAALLRAFSAEF